MYRARFDFGKYSGQLVANVPSGYLQWVLRECDSAEPWLKNAIRDELHRRGVDAGDGRRSTAPPPCPTCARVKAELSSLFRRLALVCHPDKGGSHGAMVAVNTARERVEELMR
jgi:hypothetical protein